VIDPAVSPFVNLFSQAGIAAAAIIMNLVVLSSVMSSMNSGVFSTSRMLFGLSREVVWMTGPTSNVYEGRIDLSYYQN
jgi:D-serine/D-alanine/glycine transporter